MSCGSKQVKKSGWQNGHQRYKCNTCGRRFDGGRRLNPDALWQEYTRGKQTALQLAQRYGCSRKTILRYLKKYTAKSQYAAPAKANIIMDTTYFGRTFGIMVLYDGMTKQALFVGEVQYETNALYAAALAEIKAKGIEIQSIVCDGRKGLMQLYPDTPTQLCHFHQVQILNRYLTRNPKTKAGKALRQLALSLKHSTKKDFHAAFETWYGQHKAFLNERSINEETGKSGYTHKRLRSAYFSLKRNLPYLFVFEDYPDLDIPNTTNLLDGRFADLKQKLRCHQGMSMECKVRFIKDYFSCK
ncbi:IS256 family transposase, variant Zn-binding type [Bergeriella denitrificans]